MMFVECAMSYTPTYVFMTYKQLPVEREHYYIKTSHQAKEEAGKRRPDGLETRCGTREYFTGTRALKMP